MSIDRSIIIHWLERMVGWLEDAAYARDYGALLETYAGAAEVTGASEELVVRLRTLARDGECPGKVAAAELSAIVAELRG